MTQAKRPHIAPQDLRHAQDHVGYHPVIAYKWQPFFKGDISQAARSWFEYSQEHPHSPIEQWFAQFDPHFMEEKERVPAI